MEQIKVDLVMWTYNSEKNLPAVLQRINEVIPPEVVNKKIITDDHSKDKTREIAQSFGWEVHMNKGKGVHDNTKTAIDLVSTPYFCSFEHDVILSREWWEKIVKQLDDPNVAVAQGIRISTNRVFRVIDDYSSNRSDKEFGSLDNNLAKTEFIREFGYNEVGTPPTLRARGLKWVIDRSIVSDHIRDDLWENIRHDHKMQALVASTTKDRLQSLRLLLTSPLRAVSIAFKKKSPIIMFYYPIDRFAIFLGALKNRATK
jgi:glycosyltransferase involved in cell wall biosynthesis